MQELDRIAIEDVRIPALVLMEVAGRAVADAVYERYLEEPGLVLSVAGSGNNGGDAVVAARHLKERGVPVELVVLADPQKLSKHLERELEIAAALGLDSRFLSGDGAGRQLELLVERATYAIDGLFGTGLSRIVEGFSADAIKALTFDDLTVISVDLPSGIDADTGAVLGVAVEADITVTFQYPKLGHVLYPGRAHAGEIRVVDIGIPPSQLAKVEPWAELIEDDVVDQAVPLRAPDTHKGTYGHLMVVGGIPDRPGAVLLAGRAALRAGTGLVTVAADPVTINRIAGNLDELMGRSLTSIDDAISALEQKTALVIGPSLPPIDATKQMVRAMLEATRVPALIDAGGLAALGTDLKWLKKRVGPTILTPHPGEMGKLTGLDSSTVQSDRIHVANGLAENYDVYVVLKGASTIVSSPDGKIGVSLAGNAGMATGGTGDVLAGVIGGLLAQGVEPQLAVRAGTHLHGLAGDHAAKENGEAPLVASDVIRSVGHVLREREG